MAMYTTSMYSACNKLRFCRLLVKINKQVISYNQCLYLRSATQNDQSQIRESQLEDDDTDFFGIIEGKGVKDVSTHKNRKEDPFIKYEYLMRKPAEDKVYVTTFGTIRFDADNKPNSDPHPRPEFDTIKEETYDKITRSKRAEQKIKKNDEYSGRQYKERSTRKTSDNELIRDETENRVAQSNYVDEMYFGNAIDVAQNNTNTESIEKEQMSEQMSVTHDEKRKSDGQGNYIDHLYFGDVERQNKLKNAGSSEIGFGSGKELDQLKFLGDQEMSYVDQMYFGSKKNEEKNDTNVNELNRKLEEESEVFGTVKQKDKKIKSKEVSLEVVEKYEQREKSTTARQFLDERTKNVNAKVDESVLNNVKSDTKHEAKINEAESKKKSRVKKTEQKTEDIKKTTVEVDSKYEEPEKKTARQHLIQLRNEKVKKDIEQGRVVSQVIDLNAQPEYEVFNVLKNSVIYNDSDVVAINKPYGLPCQQGAKHRHMLLQFLPELAKHVNADELYPVHRLDAGTTGVLLLAKTEKMSHYLKSLFKTRKLTKTYWAITKGVPDPPEGMINIPIAEGTILGRARRELQPDYNQVTKVVLKKSSKSSQEAKTEYKTISQSGNAALVELVAHTGITHQLRVHLGFGLGCPILGDHKYTYIKKLAPQKLSGDMLKRLNIRQSKVRDLPIHLHARSVIIPELIDGRNVFIKADLSKHFRWAMQRLKLHKE